MFWSDDNDRCQHGVIPTSSNPLRWFLVLRDGGFALISPSASQATPSYTKEELKGHDQRRAPDWIYIPAVREAIQREAR